MCNVYAIGKKIIYVGVKTLKMKMKASAKTVRMCTLLYLNLMQIHVFTIYLQIEAKTRTLSYRVK